MSAMAPSPAMSKTSNGRVALLVVLGTESVFFVTLLVAYGALRGQVGWNVPHTLARLTVPLANSAVLLGSALMAWWAGEAIQQGDRRGLWLRLLVTLLLGLLFVAGQIYEFGHAGLHIDDEAFGGVFFTLLGSHAVHVLAGVVVLALNLARAVAGDFTAEAHEAVTLGNWFWFYVSGVWIVLFVALYLV